MGRPLRAAPTKSSPSTLSLKGARGLSEDEKGDCPFFGTVPFFEGMGKEGKEIRFLF